MNPLPTASARDRILFHLKTLGPQTAAQLARRLDVTPMAVRQHLQALSGEGLVSHEEERRKLGRPARVWSLTRAAARRFPDAHAGLAVELLEAVRRTFGDDGLERLVGECSRLQRTGYVAQMPAAGAPVQERVAAIAAIRSGEGYMSEWSSAHDESWLLAQNHCPICTAAAACQSFCRDELSIFRELLGSDVTVTRIEHVLAGARRCAYRIEPRGTASGNDGMKAGPETPDPGEPA